MKFSIYRDSEKPEIQALFTQAFSDSEGPSEGELIGGLAFDLMSETDDKDILGFTANENEQIVGCIFFTRLSLRCVKAFDNSKYW